MMEHTTHTPVEWRIAIADSCGADDYRETVLESDSNTDGAIYYRKPHLTAIAAALGVTQPAEKTVGSLRAAIRRNAVQKVQLQTESPQQAEKQGDTPSVRADGGSTTQMRLSGGGSRFAHVELPTLAKAVEADPDAPYFEVELRRLAGSSIAGPYLSLLVSEAYVNLYVSGNVGSVTSDLGPRAYYPFVMHRVDEVPESAAERPQCYKYVIDSAIGNSECGNQETLDTACRVDADAAVIADVYGDMEGTVEAVLDGVDLYADHAFNGQLVIPLQPPHGECLKRLLSAGVSRDHIFAVGGMKDASDEEKLEAARTVREVLGPEPHLHGLGFGITDEMAAGIRDEPDLLDSVDASTVLQSSIGDMASGEERLSSVAALGGAQLVEKMRKISPLVEGDSEMEQAMMSGFGR